MGATEQATVVMGAGPGGLAAGYWLAKHGVPVTVLERADVVGGLARTIERDGFRFDIGGHRWFTKKDELNSFIEDLLGDELVVVKRTSRILFRGKSVDYPLRLTNALASIGSIAAARAAESGKPANIVEKMVEGAVAKFLAEVTLLAQPFVKGDGKQSVEQLVKGQGATINGFTLYVVGEGIEKKKDDFAAEVAAMAKA